MPPLSNETKRASEILKHNASKQITDYEQRFSTLRNLYDDLLSDLVRTDFKSKETYETAENFFGTDRVCFAGVDGTARALIFSRVYRQI